MTLIDILFKNLPVIFLIVWISKTIKKRKDAVRRAESERLKTAVGYESNGSDTESGVESSFSASADSSATADSSAGSAVPANVSEESDTERVVSDVEPGVTPQSRWDIAEKEAYESETLWNTYEKSGYDAARRWEGIESGDGRPVKPVYTEAPGKIASGNAAVSGGSESGKQQSPGKTEESYADDVYALFKELPPLAAGIMWSVVLDKPPSLKDDF